MKPTSEILERIERCSSEHKDGVFTRLYRYLLREDIYYAAYQKLYANKGATTQGIDDDTADGFSDFYVKELIQSLKDGTYKANPVRREYIPKKNGKLRRGHTHGAYKLHDFKVFRFGFLRFQSDYEWHSGISEAMRAISDM